MADYTITITITVSARNAQSALAKAVRCLYSGRSHYDSAMVHARSGGCSSHYLEAYAAGLSPADKAKLRAACIVFQPPHRKG